MRDVVVRVGDGVGNGVGGVGSVLIVVAVVVVFAAATPRRRRKRKEEKKEEKEETRNKGRISPYRIIPLLPPPRVPRRAFSRPRMSGIHILHAKETVAVLVAVALRAREEEEEEEEEEGEEGGGHGKGKVLG